MNAAATLPVASVRGVHQAAFLAAFVLPAVATWVALGMLLSLADLPEWFALIAACAYSAYYGIGEVLSGRPRGPGTAFQVPDTMLRGRPAWRRVLIWGVYLGPGLVTRNPFAGYGLLPLLVVAGGINYRGAVAGGLVGLAHGAARASGIRRNIVSLRWNENPLQRVLAELQWRRADGFLLLAVAGLTAAEAVRVLRSS